MLRDCWKLLFESLTHLTHACVLEVENLMGQCLFIQTRGEL